jgi:Protein of unknown function (DUF3054).
MVSTNFLLVLVLILRTGSIHGFQLSRPSSIATTASIATTTRTRLSTTASNFHPMNHNLSTALKSTTNDREQESPPSTTASSTSNNPLGALSSTSSPFNNPILATLDFAALVLFAGIGKANHDTTTGAIDLQSTLSTAAPFVISWYATSPFTGIYDSTSSTSKSGGDDGTILEAGKIAAKGWIVAIPLGCALRGVIKGYVPPVPFVVVTMIATLILLGGARVLYAAATTTKNS